MIYNINIYTKQRMCDDSSHVHCNCCLRGYARGR